MAIHTTYYYYVKIYDRDFNLDKNQEGLEGKLSSGAIGFSRDNAHPKNYPFCGLFLHPNVQAFLAFALASSCVKCGLLLLPQNPTVGLKGP